MRQTVVVDRPGRGLIRLTGEQRVWFLQNTVTSDVEAIAPGAWAWSLFLDHKGHVLARFRVGVLDDAIWLDVDPPATSDLVDWFVRYRFRTKVEIEDRTTAAHAVVGPGAAGVAAAGAIVERDGAIVFGDVLGDVPVADVHASEAPVWLAELPAGDAGLIDVLRVEAGVGAFGVDYGPDTLPQEAALASVVSVTKGCYVGQEVMSRLHFRGHVNRSVRSLRLVGVEPEAAIGRDLRQDGKVVGRVTSAVTSPSDGPIALGIVRMEVEPEAEVELDGGTAVVGPVPDGTTTA